MMKKNLIVFSLLCSLPFVAYAQVTSRSGNPGGNGSGSPENLPCEGPAIFVEDFESGLPISWNVLDLDSLTPRPEMGLSPGWQEREDYKDSTNLLMVSPSWYITPDTSDDWLISSVITVGTNTCLSWAAYSQDQYYPESYEVRISTTTPNTAGFFANPPLLSVEEEGHDWNYRSVNLSAFAGQQVYLAFRQTSDDQFVLAIDDIKMSDVQTLDAGVFSLNALSGDIGDTLEIRGFVANYGTDSIFSISVHWQADALGVSTMNLDSLSLGPNDTVEFVHGFKFVPDTVPHIYNLCAWTSLPNSLADQKISNDTNCIFVNIGNAIGVEDPISEYVRFEFWPNPATEEIFISLSDFIGSFRAEIRDISGKLLYAKKHEATGEPVRMDIPNLPQGYYLLRIEAKGFADSVKPLIIR